VPSPTLDRLVALVDGRIEPQAFTAHVTAPPGRRLEEERRGLARVRFRNGAREPADDTEDVALAGVSTRHAPTDHETPPG
jgi:hypothetical protein